MDIFQNLDLRLLRSFFWFAAGALSYRLVSNFVGYVRIAAYAMEINDILLTMVGKLTDDLLFVRELKYKTLSAASWPEDKLAAVREYDDFVLQNWKHLVINTMVTTYPKRLRFLLSFETWDEAMNKLTQIHKKG